VSVTDAQFRELLRGQSGGEHVLLAEMEFAYQTAVGPGTGTVYFADGKYRTKEGESPARTRYRDVITKVSGFARAIDYRKLGGRRSMTDGEMRLANPDGELDFMLDLIADGREVRFYSGRGGDHPWPRADFRQVNAALVVAVKGDTNEITIALRAKNYALDDSVVGSPIGGSGPNPGTPAPVLLGCIKNFDFTPYCTDPTNLVYKINDFALDTGVWDTDQIDVRDGGLSLTNGGIVGLFLFDNTSMSANVGTETLTRTSNHGLAVDDIVIFRGSGGTLFAGLAEHTQYWVIAAGLTPTDFRVSLTRGGAAVNITGAVLTGTWSLQRRRYYIDAAAATITMSSLPTFKPALDYNVIDAAGELGSNQAPHKAFKYLLTHYSKLATTEYDATSLDALATAEFGLIRCSIPIINRTNLINILDAIAASTYSWYGWSGAGVLTVGRLDLANLDSVTATATIAQTELATDTDISVENLPLPWGKVTVDSDPNASLISTFAGNATATERAAESQPYRVQVTTTDPAGTTYLDNWWDYHKSAIDSAPIQLQIGTPDMSGIYLLSPAQDVCDAITELFKPYTRVYRETVGIEWYDLDPGDCVELVHARYGLADGKNVRVVSVAPDFVSGTCDLVFVAQNDPDYLTSSYA
jgi:hypothetical protein